MSQVKELFHFLPLCETWRQPCPLPPPPPPPPPLLPSLLSFAHLSAQHLFISRIFKYESSCLYEPEQSLSLPLISTIYIYIYIYTRCALTQQAIDCFLLSIHHSNDTALKPLWPSSIPPWDTFPFKFLSNSSDRSIIFLSKVLAKARSFLRQNKDVGRPYSHNIAAHSNALLHR